MRAWKRDRLRYRIMRTSYLMFSDKNNIGPTSALNHKNNELQYLRCRQTAYQGVAAAADSDEEVKEALVSLRPLLIMMHDNVRLLRDRYVGAIEGDENVRKLRRCGCCAWHKDPKDAPENCSCDAPSISAGEVSELLA